jgi:hypothetical protein
MLTINAVSRKHACFGDCVTDRVCFAVEKVPVEKLVTKEVPVTVDRVVEKVSTLDSCPPHHLTLVASLRAHFAYFSVITCSYARRCQHMRSLRLDLI